LRAYQTFSESITETINQTFILRQNTETQNKTQKKTMAFTTKMSGFEKQLAKIVMDREARESVMALVGKTFSRKSKKESSGPKRPPNAYIQFMTENRGEIRDTMIADYNGDDEDYKPSTGEVTKEAARLWKAMEESEKAKWVEKQRMALEAFKAEHPELVKSGGSRSATPKSAFEFDTAAPEDMEVPSGWTKVFKGKYLHKNAAGIKSGVGKFATLSEAIKASEELGSKSGGVTRTNRGFFVRVSNDPVTEKSLEKRQYTYSWVKEDFEVPDEPKKPKKTKKEKKAKTPDPEPEVEEECVAAVPVPVVNKIEKEEKESTYDEETDDESDDDDEDEDGFKSVTTWEFKGKTYLIDDEEADSCNVFDFETQDKIGTRTKKANGKFKLTRD